MAQLLFTAEIGTPTPLAFSAANNNTRLTLDLFPGTTIVTFTTTSSITFNGLAAIGGNTHNMVVVLSNVSTGSFSVSFAHESGSETVVANRFRNVSGSAANGGVGIGCVWYRYNANIGPGGRWTEIGRTG